MGVLKCSEKKYMLAQSEFAHEGLEDIWPGDIWCKSHVLLDEYVKNVNAKNIKRFFIIEFLPPISKWAIT